MNRVEKESMVAMWKKGEIMMKEKSNCYFLTIVLGLLLSATMFVNQGAKAAINWGTAVNITGAGQVVDSITVNGKTVQALYAPRNSVANYDGNETYSCAAFVKRFYSEVFGIGINNLYPGNTPNIYSGSGQFSKTSSPKVGDIAANSGHWAIVKAVNGNSVTLIEQNAWNTAYTAAMVGRILTSESSYWFWRWSGNNASVTEPQISYNPEGNLESIEGGLNGVSIRGWVFDRDSLSSSVPIHVYMDGVYAGAGVADKKRADVNNAHGCGEYHGFDFMLPIESSGTHALEVYAINIGADGQPSGQGNLLMGGTSVSIVVDETPPVISDVRILDLDSSGYTIECKATDNRGIDRVQCPTWTVANGQDDLQNDWWTDTSVKATDKGNGVFQFRVNISEHNSERGLYITHIYAYDEAGNYAVHKVEDVEVLEDSGTIAPGDINQDGKIDGKDISMLLQYRLKKRELTEEQIADGDVYKDGKIDGKDVSRLLQYRLGKISSLN